MPFFRHIRRSVWTCAAVVPDAPAGAHARAGLSEKEVLALCDKVQAGDQAALQTLLDEAHKENPYAQYYLSDCYIYGKGVAKDFGQAAQWRGRAAQRFRKAAQQGDADAQYYLGFCSAYGFGDLAFKDRSQAAHWWRKAAKQGHAGAQNLLGLCYFYGDGVAQDQSQAMHWWRKAAQQGHVDAQTSLAEHDAKEKPA